jgi:hypothetical protein
MSSSGIMKSQRRTGVWLLVAGAVQAAAIVAHAAWHMPPLTLTLMLLAAAAAATCAAFFTLLAACEDRLLLRPSSGSQHVDADIVHDSGKGSAMDDNMRDGSDIGDHDLIAAVPRPMPVGAAGSAMKRVGGKPRKQTSFQVPGDSPPCHPPPRPPDSFNLQVKRGKPPGPQAILEDESVTGNSNQEASTQCSEDEEEENGLDTSDNGLQLLTPAGGWDSPFALSSDETRT